MDPIQQLMQLLGLAPRQTPSQAHMYLNGRPNPTVDAVAARAGPVNRNVMRQGGPNPAVRPAVTPPQDPFDPNPPPQGPQPVRTENNQAARYDISSRIPPGFPSGREVTALGDGAAPPSIPALDVYEPAPADPQIIAQQMIGEELNPMSPGAFQSGIPSPAPAMPTQPYPATPTAPQQPPVQQAALTPRPTNIGAGIGSSIPVSPPPVQMAAASPQPSAPAVRSTAPGPTRGVIASAIPRQPPAIPANVNPQMPNVTRPPGPINPNPRPPTAMGGPALSSAPPPPTIRSTQPAPVRPPPAPPPPPNPIEAQYASAQFLQAPTTMPPAPTPQAAPPPPKLRGAPPPKPAPPVPAAVKPQTPPTAPVPGNELPQALKDQLLAEAIRITGENRLKNRAGTGPQ